jgi:hypothetical protein
MASLLGGASMVVFCAGPGQFKVKRDRGGTEDKARRRWLIYILGEGPKKATAPNERRTAAVV